ncbi:MAG: hypothetical protein KDA27_12605, partial [Candidatus Eisenbacteria bacterium]|nr:hypothetical protein [Candidatus Eisenbacteria bacterium]
GGEEQEGDSGNASPRGSIGGEIDCVVWKVEGSHGFAPRVFRGVVGRAARRDGAMSDSASTRVPTMEGRNPLKANGSRVSTSG